MLNRKLECLLVSTEPANSFGTWLHDAMVRKGYDVDGPRAGGRTKLAKQSGVSLSIISRILNEDRVPEVPALRAIGNVLDYTLGEMMVFAGLAEPDEMGAEHPKPAPGVAEPEDHEPTLEDLIGEPRDDFEREVVAKTAVPVDYRLKLILMYRQVHSIDQQQRAEDDVEDHRSSRGA
jgi:transcriptional regulator with XRE-family HTH domain